MHADERQELDVIYAGEIGATVGLKGTSTGHTLCDKISAGYFGKNCISRASYWN